MIEIKTTGAEEYGPFLKMMVCGDSKSDKTAFASTFPNPLFASAWGGLMGIADRHLPYTKIEATDQLRELYKLLQQPPATRQRMFGCQVDTIVVDTLDEIQRILMRERTVAKKDECFNYKDYGWLGEQMQNITKVFRNLDMHVLFLAHVRESRDEELGRVLFKPGFGGQFCDIVTQYVDFAFLLSSRTSRAAVGDEVEITTRHILQTAPDERFTWIDDGSRRLPGEIELDLETDYKTIREMIFTDPPAKRPDIVRVGESDIVKKELLDRVRNDPMEELDDGTKVAIIDGRFEVSKVRTRAQTVAGAAPGALKLREEI